MKEYLIKRGVKDAYINEYTDENGNYHPGYRGYEKIAPMVEHIKKIISDEHDGNNEVTAAIAQKVANKVIELINTCQDFYRFNGDECKFRNTLAMGASPTSNAETVKKWWKDHYNVDIEIVERNPLLLWEYDNYGDQMDEIMTDDYGENWEQIWWDKYHKEEAEKKAKLEEALKNTKNDI